MGPNISFLIWQFIVCIISIGCVNPPPMWHFWGYDFWLALHSEKRQQTTLGHCHFRAGYIALAVRALVCQTKWLRFRAQFTQITLTVRALVRETRRLGFRPPLNSTLLCSAHLNFSCWPRGTMSLRFTCKASKNCSSWANVWLVRYGQYVPTYLWMTAAISCQSHESYRPKLSHRLQSVNGKNYVRPGKSTSAGPILSYDKQIPLLPSKQACV